MGILYNSVKLSQESKKQIMVQDLLEIGITETKEGRNINELDYYELVHQLVLYRLEQE